MFNSSKKFLAIAGLFAVSGALAENTPPASPTAQAPVAVAQQATQQAEQAKTSYLSLQALKNGAAKTHNFCCAPVYNTTAGITSFATKNETAQDSVGTFSTIAAITGLGYYLINRFPSFFNNPLIEKDINTYVNVSWRNALIATLTTLGGYKLWNFYKRMRPANIVISEPATDNVDTPADTADTSTEEVSDVTNEVAPATHKVEEVTPAADENTNFDDAE